jgi:hypothetical protein
MEYTFSWLSQSHRMSKDNDGLCATAEAFVYVAMTRPMMVFRAFHAAFAVEMLHAIAYVLWYVLSDRRRRLLHIGAASLIGEGMLISANGGDFPLGGLQERLGEPVPLFKLVVSPTPQHVGICHRVWMR